MPTPQNIEQPQASEERRSGVDDRRLVRIDKDHGYASSRDYEYLYEAAKKTSIVCIVDSFECRDICATSFHGDCHQVNARGIGYIYANSKEEFLEQCQKLNLEFLLLPNAKSPSVGATGKSI